MISIIRNVFGSAYTYTMPNHMGVPVTFDFSSKNIDSLRVRYEITPSFLLKAKMGLFDEGFSSLDKLSNWIGMAQATNSSHGRDIAGLLLRHVDFNFKGIRRPQGKAFHYSEHEGFAKFVHRCLTEFRRAIDGDILDKYKTDSGDGDVILNHASGLGSKPVNAALFRWGSLYNLEYGCCTVEYDIWWKVLTSSAANGYYYSDGVRDYLKSKLG